MIDKSKRISVFLLVLTCAGCGPAENDPGPGGVTVGEARALDEAAEMLDERNISPEKPTESSGDSDLSSQED